MPHIQKWMKRIEERAAIQKAMDILEKSFVKQYQNDPQKKQEMIDGAKKFMGESEVNSFAVVKVKPVQKSVVFMSLVQYVLGLHCAHAESKICIQARLLYLRKPCSLLLVLPFKPPVLGTVPVCSSLKLTANSTQTLVGTTTSQTLNSLYICH